MNKIILDAEGYDSLADVLRRAFDQASGGKGKERHATDLPFDQQPMQTLASLYGPGFLLGQAAKKSQESQRLPVGRDVAELLGAINYLAGTVIYLERQHAAKAEVVEPAPAPDNGWKIWTGGKNPADGQVVEYILRGGWNDKRPAKFLNWDHDGRNDDIMKYRIVHG